MPTYQRFTKEEIEELRQAIKRFCAVYQITELELFEGCKRHKDIECLRGSWAEISNSFPNKKIQNVKRNGKRLIHPFKRGPWSKEEIETLHSLVALHGSKWTIIQDLIDRLADDCYDKYKEELSRNRKLGAWTMEEVENFRKMIAKFLRINPKTADFADLVKRVEQRDMTLPFTTFSQMMGYKRSRKQLWRFWSIAAEKVNQGLSVSNIDLTGASSSSNNAIVTPSKNVSSDEVQLPQTTTSMDKDGVGKTISRGTDWNAVVPEVHHSTKMLTNSTNASAAIPIVTSSSSRNLPKRTRDLFKKKDATKPSSPVDRSDEQSAADSVESEILPDAITSKESSTSKYDSVHDSPTQTEENSRRDQLGETEADDNVQNSADSVVSISSSPTSESSSSVTSGDASDGASDDTSDESSQNSSSSTQPQGGSHIALDSMPSRQPTDDEKSGSSANNIPASSLVSNISQELQKKTGQLNNAASKSKNDRKPISKKNSCWKQNADGNHPDNRGARFGAYNKFVLLSAINKYCDSSKVSASSLFDPFQNNISMMVWKGIAKAFPDKTLGSIYRVAIKALNPHKHGPWSEDEVARLHYIVQKHGPRWTIISKSLNRSTHDCAQKYREINSDQASRRKRKLRRLPKAVRKQLRQLPKDFISKFVRTTDKSKLIDKSKLNAFGDVCSPPPNGWRYTDSEVKTLRDAIDRCCTIMNISKSVLSRGKSAIVLKAWRKIAESLPHRTLLSVHSKGLNLVGPTYKKGPWSPGEIKQLHLLVDKHGNDWKLIQNKINRAAMSCRAKYCCAKYPRAKYPRAKYKAFSKPQLQLNVNTGRWQEDEIATLKKLIKRHLDIDDPGVDLQDLAKVVAKRGVILPFSKLSRHKRLKRSPKQCSRLWSHVMDKFRRNKQAMKEYKKKEKQREKAKKKKREKAKKKKRKREEHENLDDMEQPTAANAKKQKAVHRDQQQDLLTEESSKKEKKKKKSKKKKEKRR